MAAREPRAACPLMGILVATRSLATVGEAHTHGDRSLRMVCIAASCILVEILRYKNTLSTDFIPGR